MVNKFESGDFSGGPQRSGYSSYDNGGYYSPFPSWDGFTLLDESQAKKRFSRVFLAIFLFQVISFVLMIAAQIAAVFIFGKENGLAIISNYTFILVANFVAMYLIGFPILYLTVRKMRSVERPKRDMKLGELFSLFLVAEAFMYVGNIIGNYLNAFIGSFFNVTIDNGVAEIIENAPLWLMIGMVVLIGPIVEELIFRKLFFDKLGHYGDRLIIVVSAIAFGFFHGNFYQFFYATLIGLVLGYAYSKTSNILYPIILHVAINFFGAMVPMLIYDDINAFTELYELMLSGAEYDVAQYTRVALVVGLYSLSELAMVIAGTVIFFKKRRSIFVSDRCEVLIPKKKRIAVIIFNVGAILFLAFAVLMMAAEIITPITEALSATPPADGTPNLPPDIPAEPDAGSNPQQPIPGDSLIWLIKSLIR